MKEELLEYFISNGLALFWFVSGWIFFVIAVISAINNENEKSLACVGICLACHARSEVKILQRKVEKRDD